MRLLLDANLSPRLVPVLQAAGHHVNHVVELGLLTATDRAILDRARIDGWIVITADSDFPMLLALSGAAMPSVVLLRGVADLSPDAHGQLLVANLPAVAQDLERGAVVSLSPNRIRVRDLPIQ
jgi:predicted nuclease of predicted toxin-antitoxin system